MENNTNINNTNDYNKNIDDDINTNEYMGTFRWKKINLEMLKALNLNDLMDNKYLND